MHPSATLDSDCYAFSTMTKMQKKWVEGKRRGRVEAVLAGPFGGIGAIMALVGVGEGEAQSRGACGAGWR